MTDLKAHYSVVFHENRIILVRDKIFLGNDKIEKNHLEALKICLAGTLHVITAQARIYISIINFMLFIAGNMGTKNRPSQIIP